MLGTVVLLRNLSLSHSRQVLHFILWFDNIMLTLHCRYQQIQENDLANQEIIWY